MGREKDHPLSRDQMYNALDLLERIRDLEKKYIESGGTPFVLTSGYRPPLINEHVVGAKKGDAHERCMGIDLRDRDLCLSDFLLQNKPLLEHLGLWMESPQSAVNHCHLQSFPPKSGRRVFLA